MAEKLAVAVLGTVLSLGMVSAALAQTGGAGTVPDGTTLSGPGINSTGGLPPAPQGKRIRHRAPGYEPSDADVPYGYSGYYNSSAPPATYDYSASAAQGGNVGWCQAHFRSFNPATGMYLGFDGQRHPCP